MSKTDDQLSQLARPIERQEVSGVVHRHHFDAGDQAAVVLALAYARPILVPPDQHRGQADISICRSGGFPTSGIAQKSEEGAVVTAPIPHVVHFLHERRWDA